MKENKIKSKHLFRTQEFCQKYRKKNEMYDIKRVEAKGKKRQRIVSLSDFHVPFQRDDIIQFAIDKYSGADYCVLNGDIFDNNLISKFPKKREVPFIVEFVTVTEIVQLLSRHFGKVILVDGNHEHERFSQEMGKLNQSVRFLIKNSPLVHIAKGERFDLSGEPLDPIYLDNVVYAGDIGENWWTKIGSCIFAHRLKGFRKGPMNNAVQMAGWFSKWEIPYQGLVLGHSHSMGKIPYQGKLVIDQGALHVPMEYTKDGRCTMGPSDIGFAVIELDKDGNVDYESSNPVYFGTYSGVNLDD